MSYHSYMNILLQLGRKKETSLFPAQVFKRPLLVLLSFSSLLIINHLYIYWFICDRDDGCTLRGPFFETL